MNPVRFPEASHTLAKNQPQYRALPALIIDLTTFEEKLKGNVTPSYQFTCKYDLSDLEIQQIIKTRGFYLSQYGSVFHPILPQVEHFVKSCPIEYLKLENGNYDIWIPMQDLSEIHLEDVAETRVIDVILHHATNLRPENIHFVERKTKGINPEGKIVNL